MAPRIIAIVANRWLWKDANTLELVCTEPPPESTTTVWMESLVERWRYKPPSHWYGEVLSLPDDRVWLQVAVPPENDTVLLDVRTGEPQLTSWEWRSLTKRVLQPKEAHRDDRWLVLEDGKEPWWVDHPPHGDVWIPLVVANRILYFNDYYKDGEWHHEASNGRWFVGNVSDVDWWYGGSSLFRNNTQFFELHLDVICIDKCTLSDDWLLVRCRTEWGYVFEVYQLGECPVWKGRRDVEERWEEVQHGRGAPLLLVEQVAVPRQPTPLWAVYVSDKMFLWSTDLSVVYHEQPGVFSPPVVSESGIAYTKFENKRYVETYCVKC